LSLNKSPEKDLGLVGRGWWDLENCAYLWKNPGYAPELFVEDSGGPSYLPPPG